MYISREEKDVKEDWSFDISDYDEYLDKSHLKHLRLRGVG